MRLFFHGVFLFVFLIYSQSALVMWSLYLVEEHDIVLYYETTDDTSNGLHFMQTLCDAERGEHDGALALLKVVEQSQPYVAALQQAVTAERHYSSLPLNNQSELPASPQRDPLLRPPCQSNLA